MSDSTESGSSRNPLDPNDIIGAGPDRRQELDADENSGSGPEEEGADDTATASTSEPGGVADAEYPESGNGEAGQDKYPNGERPWEGS